MKGYKNKWGKSISKGDIGLSCEGEKYRTGFWRDFRSDTSRKKNVKDNGCRQSDLHGDLGELLADPLVDLQVLGHAPDHTGSR